MAKLKLNHDKIRELMGKKGIRLSNLARKMGHSSQMAYYIIRRGGPKYAPDLASHLGCEIVDILTPGPNIILSQGYGLGINQITINHT